MTTGDAHLELVRADTARADADPAALPAATDAVHRLGAGLFRELASRTGNLGLSPYSAVAALGMTLDGTARRTREEMLAVFGVDSAAELDAGMNALTRHIESLAVDSDHADRRIELSAANELFGQHGYPWSPAFLDSLATAYGAGLRTVDFVGTPEAARAAVNEWTAGRTHDRIQEIIPRGTFNEFTRLVLVNALYFKARWAEQFLAGDTSNAPFHLADGTAADVPMMTKTLKYASYGRGDGWQAVRLPYVGGTVAMTILMPDTDRLTDVEAAVGEGGLASIVTAVRRIPLELSLPRWKFDVGSGLAPALANLGMRTLFDPDAADLTAMTTTEEDLFVAAVLQKVFVAVDEHGTEAAAATAVVVQTATGFAEPPFRVVVDRPFLFVIHDVEHGTPLFLGRVADPRS